MSASWTTSPVLSTPQSLPSQPPLTPLGDDLEARHTSPETTTFETDASPSEFNIDWDNIWHCGKRLAGVKKRPRHKRVIGTKIKESWIYRHGANLEHRGTASNGFHYIGIIGHFVDNNGRKRDTLLGLPRLVGPHSSKNITPHVKEVIDQYEIGAKLGYFMLDNADSNDTCLQTLAQWFPMDVGRRRLRCIGHIINLVVRAVIFGSNVSRFKAELRAATDEFSFDIWAKKGAIGRLHNLATYAFADAISDYTALELRSAIELYQSRWQKPKNDPVHRDLTKDFLGATDWTELERFHNFLKPFYVLTKTMEGNASALGAEGGHGAVWETLKTIDYLFVKFKHTAEETRFEEPSHFKSGINCRWRKLKDYYVKTDRTPVYQAALALHPSYRYDYFERH
ncbi:hypothetical protein PWT90_10996 [Aphanocladium album]|nr:hypothetical protein PWT90_10996 [Aphanocladium album]